MRLQPRIAIVSCLAALLSVGATGLLLIRQSESFAAEQLAQRQELLVRNRALGISASLNLAMREMVRLSHMAELDLTDNDLRPEAALLAHAHHNSTLFNIGLEIDDAAGHCLWTEPENPSCRRSNRSTEPWFIAGRVAQGPLVVSEPHNEAPTEINVVVPIGRKPDAWDGVLRGIIDLRSDRVVSPALTDGLPPGTQLALVSREGSVLFPSDAPHGAGWARAVAAAPREAGGNFLTQEGSARYMYAYAEVEGVQWGLVCRWNYATLDTGLSKQLVLLLEILVLGILLAVALALLSSRFLTRPLESLAGSVRGFDPVSQAPRPAAVTTAARTSGGADEMIPMISRQDEIGELARAFADLRKRIAERDAVHNDDMSKIRELASSLEERVHARTAQLEAAQRSLVAQERLAAMGHAAAVISHELKNSLNALGLGFDFLALDAPEGSQARKVNVQVRAEVIRLRSMTDHLLAFARAPRLDAHPADLHELLRSTMRLCEGQTRSAGIDVEARLADGGAPLVVPLDRDRMRSVLLNLLQNAIQALDREQRPVRQIVVTTEHGGDAGGVRISIEDSGPGVPPEAREHLFEPFFSTKRNGTGLGLATAQRFVTAHGGRLELLSSRLGGACFLVTLPDRTPTVREAA